MQKFAIDYDEFMDNRSNSDIEMNMIRTYRNKNAKTADINHIDNLTKHIDYFEAVIDEDGVVHELAGSHNDALLYLASIKYGLSMGYIEAATPEQFYFAFDEFLLKLSNSVSVRFNESHVIDGINDSQIRTLESLVNNDIIKKNIVVTHSFKKENELMQEFDEFLKYQALHKNP